MKLFDSLREKLAREDKRESFVFRPFHSSFYHHQFEGYTEYRRPDKNGKLKLTRVYTGQFYRTGISRKRMIAERFCYTLFFVLSAAAFLWTSTLNIEANKNSVLTLITVFTVPALFWFGTGLVNFISGKELLTIHLYKSGPERLKTTSLVSAILMFVKMPAVLILAISVGGDLQLGDFGIMISSCISAAGFFIINRLETAKVYETVINAVQPENDGIEIH